MNLPEVSPLEDQAIDAIVTIINQAKSRLNDRLTLNELARSRGNVAENIKVYLHHLHHPLGKHCESFLVNTIEHKWKLTPTFSYVKRFMGSSKDESANFYYFEVVFTQPTIEYPVAQTGVSVFFKLVDKHTGPAKFKSIPAMTFRLEGHHTAHDIRYVYLTADWLLGIIKMKLKLFRRFEELKLF